MNRSDPATPMLPTGADMGDFPIDAQGRRENSDITYTDIAVRHLATAARLRTEATLTLFNWWISFAPRIPARDDFDVIDHLRIAGNLFLIQVLEGGRFEFRLCGETVVQIVGVNDRGTICDVNGPAASQIEQHYVALANHYASIVADQTPRSAKGRLTGLYRTHKQFESIDLPLLDAQGQVSHIIGAMDAIEYIDDEDEGDA